MEKKLDKNGYPLMDSEALCQEALDLWGIDAQVWMAVEEMAELTNALCKMKRGRNNPEDIITEIADVQIMMQQLQLFFGKEEVDTERNRKLIRLHDRMCDYRVVHKIDHSDRFPSLKRYSINGWDYHGHHSTEEFETESVDEAMHRFKVACQDSYGDCTLYECPNGFRGSCQTISEAGYIKIAEK